MARAGAPGIRGRARSRGDGPGRARPGRGSIDAPPGAVGSGDAAAGLSVAEAVAHLRAGGLVAFPTETVWGLGADARSEDALARLRAWKGRGPAQPVAILVAGPEALAELGLEAGAPALALAAAFWPGPLTLVVRGDGGFASGVARADGAVGVRCSPHPVAVALARALAAEGLGPLTATSLNRHGEAPAHTRAEAERLCAGAGPGSPRLVAGPDAGGSAPSTVVDCTGARPALLREGAIDAQTVARVVGTEVP